MIDEQLEITDMYNHKVDDVYNNKLFKCHLDNDDSNSIVPSNSKENNNCDNDDINKINDIQIDRDSGGDDTNNNDYDPTDNSNNISFNELLARYTSGSVSPKNEDNVQILVKKIVTSDELNSKSELNDDNIINNHIDNVNSVNDNHSHEHVSGDDNDENIKHKKMGKRKPKNKNVNVNLVSNLIDTLIVRNDISICGYKNLIIDNSLDTHTVIIENSSDYDIKRIFNLYQSLYPTIIQTNCGSFYLDDKCPIKTIIYDSTLNSSIFGWKIIGSKYNNFFPTKISESLQNNLSQSSFGSSVSISGNGSNIVVGGYTNMNCIGGAWCYENCNGSFIMNCELFVDNNIGTSFHGISSSVNFDCSVISIGGSGDDSELGSCWIYNKSQQKFKLIGSSSIGQSHQGSSIHVSPNGKKLFIGGCDDDHESGSVWYFENIENNWIEKCKISGKLFDYDSDFDNKKIIHFGKYIHSNYDGSIIAISSDNCVFILEFNDSKNYWNCVNTFNGQIDHVWMSKCSKHILIVSKYNIIHVKNHSSSMNIKKVINTQKMYNVKKIISICASENCKTIIASCTANNGKCAILCFIKINQNYELQSIIPIDMSNIKSATTHLNLSTSYDSKISVIGIPEFNDHDGICFVLS